jgi:hypothetical protein
MGFEYKHYLIPCDPSFSPDSEQLLKLINQLGQENWILNSPYAQSSSGKTYGSAVLDSQWLTTHRHPFLLLGWHIECPTLEIRYPLLPNPAEGSNYYDLQLHLSDDFVYHTSELILPFAENVQCLCGNTLEYSFNPYQDPFYDARRIQRVCPQCTRLFSPQGLTTVVHNAWTEEISQVQGGATYRFAIVILCGKDIPFTQDGRIQKPLLDLCQTLCQQEFREISDID